METKDDLNNLRITEGVQCLRCYSVLFNFDALIKHIREDNSHTWFKFGEKGVLLVKLMEEPKQLI